ncbi:MAG: hypothetical protein AB1489_25050 [Acidobacteriota bacterium]
MRKNIALSVSLFVCLVFALTMAASSNSNSNSNSSKAVPLPINPREDATVTMTFDGLMALCMGNPERVSVGILDVHHHTPTLTVSKVAKGRKAPLATLKGEQLRGTLHIDVEGASADVNKYISPAMEKDPNDFRWTVDLESDLHQRELHLKEERLFGKIHIGAGLFYSRELSTEPFRFFAMDGSGKALPFNRRVGEPAAKVNLSNDQALVIRTSQQTIRLLGESDATYEIVITNEPPAEMANLDHWMFYYQIIGEGVTTYTPVMVQKTSYAPRPFLCSAAIFSKSQLK